MPAYDFHPDEAYALKLDAEDPLRAYRDRFHIPTGPDGDPVIYFCGNSLGLQPKGVRDLIDQELNDWAELGVDAHFEGKTPWYSYHEIFRETGARLVGARPGEVVMMNSLTVNLHLMMVTFYRPKRERYKILIDWPCFPSDIYAVKTHLRHRGCDPADALVIARPRDGEHTLRSEDFEAILERVGDRIALVLLAGVNFFTGQLMDMPRLTAAAHEQGCTVGLDLAHAAGNVPLSLHDWEVDFAVWCSYKYLNAGPGAVAGCFVHERHGRNLNLPRLAGWWGNDPATRFKMHLLPDFTPRKGADGWQVSNPPIFSLAPLRASLEIFDAAGMTALRVKSERMTAYLPYLLDHAQSGDQAQRSDQAQWGGPPCPPRQAGTPAPPIRSQLGGGRYEVITPRDPARRGCQLSILMHDDAKALFKRLQDNHVVGDFREPNVIRVAPVPLYNTYHEIWRFAQIVAGDG